MSFEEFLKHIREHIGNYCADGYWKKVYENLKDKSLSFVEKETPFMAVHAVGHHYEGRNVKKHRSKSR